MTLRPRAPLALAHRRTDQPTSILLRGSLYLVALLLTEPMDWSAIMAALDSIVLIGV